MMTFRKNWGNAKYYVDNEVRYFNLPKIMKLLGNNNSDILEDKNWTTFWGAGQENIIELSKESAFLDV